MQAIILKCRPNAQFHFGTVAEDTNMGLAFTSDRMHSDTLFSAMVNIYNGINPSDTNNYVDLFRNESIKISSLSYCIENAGKYLYFFPKPASATLLVKKNLTNIKEIKGIKFISKAILEKGIEPDLWVENTGNTVDSVFIIQGKFACTIGEIRNILGVEPSLLKDINLIEYNDETKVKVHSNTTEDTLYLQNNLQLTDISEFGLYTHFFFLLEKKQVNEEIEKKNKMVFELIKHTGIGGQRSTGCGYIEDIDYDDITFNIQNPADCNLSLSLIIPQDANDLNNCKYYETMLRGGRNTGTSQKELERVRVIAEGALVEMNVKGELKDISPDKNASYLRMGKAFLIPVHRNFLP